MEGDSNGENKPASDAMEEDPCQPGQVGGGMVVQDLVCNYCKSLSDSQEPAQDEFGGGPNSIEKGDGKEQDCNLGRILESDCVFVEFRRTEASCMAGHCLHGKSCRSGLPNPLFMPDKITLPFNKSEKDLVGLNSLPGLFLGATFVSFEQFGRSGAGANAKAVPHGLVEKTVFGYILRYGYGYTTSEWRSGKRGGPITHRLKKRKKKKNTVATAAIREGVLLGNNTRFLKTQQFSISKPSPVSEGFLTSQLGGIRISYNPPKPLTAPFTPAIQPLVARRICPFTGKKANRANKVSFSNHKTKKLQFVNLQYKRVWWEAGKRYVKLRLSTKALKTIEKNGLDAVAKKAGIDLRKE
ncbi:hypothetical protein H0E87_018101 [Populus deltoides]|uniref:Large ribosomal subunit protein bL28c n=1 Tax=Populus deltoides TaxID=3696 RepID=A0A8T2Y316_POPDE|nr:hypothetical protein H0E87_018101 [Populus deltoides]